MIRLANKSDALEISRIYNFYIENTVVTFEETAVSEQTILERMEHIEQTEHFWLVAQKEDSIIGYAYSSRWQPRAAYRNTAEVSVYIANDHIGKGLGTQLYHQLFELLLDKNIHALIGGVTLPNPASVKLHEKFGMHQVAHYKEVGFKFNQWLDVGYWQKIL